MATTHASSCGVVAPRHHEEGGSTGRKGGSAGRKGGRERWEQRGGVRLGAAVEKG